MRTPCTWPIRSNYSPPFPFPSDESFENIDTFRSIFVKFLWNFFERERERGGRSKSALKSRYICSWKNLSKFNLNRNRASKDKNNSKKWFPSAYHNVTDTRAGKKYSALPRKARIKIARILLYAKESRENNTSRSVNKPSIPDRLSENKDINKIHPTFRGGANIASEISRLFIVARSG